MRAAQLAKLLELKERHEAAEAIRDWEAVHVIYVELLEWLVDRTVATRNETSPLFQIALLAQELRPKQGPWY
jgi:hypothetical protein